ncbi:unnamed protein product [Phaeothamnion confervicola]
MLTAAAEVDEETEAAGVVAAAAGPATAAAVVAAADGAAEALAVVGADRVSIMKARTAAAAAAAKAAAAVLAEFDKMLPPSSMVGKGLANPVKEAAYEILGRGILEAPTGGGGDGGDGDGVGSGDCGGGGEGGGDIVILSGVPPGGAWRRRLRLLVDARASGQLPADRTRYKFLMALYETFLAPLRTNDRSPAWLPPLLALRTLPALSRPGCGEAVQQRVLEAQEAARAAGEAVLAADLEVAAVQPFARAVKEFAYELLYDQIVKRGDIAEWSAAPRARKGEPARRSARWQGRKASRSIDREGSAEDEETDRSDGGTENGADGDEEKDADDGRAGVGENANARAALEAGRRRREGIGNGGGGGSGGNGNVRGGSGRPDSLKDFETPGAAAMEVNRSEEGGADPSGGELAPGPLQVPQLPSLLPLPLPLPLSLGPPHLPSPLPPSRPVSMEEIHAVAAALNVVEHCGGADPPTLGTVLAWEALASVLGPLPVPDPLAAAAAAASPAGAVATAAVAAVSVGKGGGMDAAFSGGDVSDAAAAPRPLRHHPLLGRRHPGSGRRKMAWWSELFFHEHDATLELLFRDFDEVGAKKQPHKDRRVNRRTYHRCREAAGKLGDEGLENEDDGSGSGGGGGGSGGAGVERDDRGGSGITGVEREDSDHKGNASDSNGGNGGYDGNGGDGRGANGDTDGEHVNGVDFSGAFDVKTSLEGLEPATFVADIYAVAHQHFRFDVVDDDDSDDSGSGGGGGDGFDMPQHADGPGRAETAQALGNPMNGAGGGDGDAGGGTRVTDGAGGGDEPGTQRRRGRGASAGKAKAREPADGDWKGVSFMDVDDVNGASSSDKALGRGAASRKKASSSGKADKDGDWEPDDESDSEPDEGVEREPGKDRGTKRRHIDSGDAGGFSCGSGDGNASGGNGDGDASGGTKSKKRGKRTISLALAAAGGFGDDGADNDEDGGAGAGAGWSQVDQSQSQAQSVGLGSSGGGADAVPLAPAMLEPADGADDVELAALAWEVTVVDTMALAAAKCVVAGHIFGPRHPYCVCVVAGFSRDRGLSAASLRRALGAAQGRKPWRPFRGNPFLVDVAEAHRRLLATCGFAVGASLTKSVFTASQMKTAAGGGRKRSPVGSGQKMAAVGDRAAKGSEKAAAAGGSEKAAAAGGSEKKAKHPKKKVSKEPAAEPSIVADRAVAAVGNPSS